MMPIVQKDNPVLRRAAKEVPVEKITEAGIKKVIEKMKKALASEQDGVAIAAPQIGESLKIFVVSGKALGQVLDEETPLPDLTFINPEIVKLSRKKIPMEEGCLSVRWLYGSVSRSEKATIRAYNERGEKIERGASGLLAQIFQHEVDHLNGVLFIDKAKGLREIKPKDVQEKSKKTV